MNSKEKYNLMKETRNLLEVLDRYDSLLSSLAEAEEEKMVNIPQALLDSTGLSDSADSLASAYSSFDSANSILQGLPDELCLKMRKKLGRKKDEEVCMITPDVAIRSNGHRNEPRKTRLQILTTASLEAEFKDYCREQGLSVNEVINRLMEAAVASK